MAYLMIQNGSGIPQKHELEGDRITIGRSPENDLTLDDISVSASHAQIMCVREVYTLRDLGSSNGTTVNGQPIIEARLKGGDTISFGGVEAQFVQLEGDELAAHFPTATRPESERDFAVKHGVKDIKPISDSSRHSAAKVTNNVGFARKALSWATLIALCAAILAIVAHQLLPRSANKAAVQNSAGGDKRSNGVKGDQQVAESRRPLQRKEDSLGLDMSLESLKQRLPTLSFISPSYLGANTTVAGNDDGDVMVFIWEKDEKVASIQCGITLSDLYTTAQRAQAMAVLNRLCDDICGNECRIWIAQQLAAGHRIAHRQFGAVVVKVELVNEQEQYRPAPGVPQAFRKPDSATLTVTFSRAR